MRHRMREREQRSVFGRVRLTKTRRRQVCVEALEARRLLATSPLIAEFQAANVSTITDEDGETSDWIEIRNTDSEALSLNGWYLTDDESDLTKWQFPDVNLDVGQQLLVYASGKDRTGASGELHTNFRLSASGEYLALVRPDGTTVAHAYDTYPSQFEDQSYGLAVGRDIVEFLPAGAPLRALVPTDDRLGQDWTQLGFDDSSWQTGVSAAGYENLQPGQTVRDDFNAPLGDEWTVDIPVGSTATQNVQGGRLLIRSPKGLDLGYTERGNAPVVYRALPQDSPLDWEVITEVRLGLEKRGAAGIAVIDTATGGAAIRLEYDRRLRFQMFSATKSVGREVSPGRDDFFLRLVRDSRTRSWNGYFRLTEADDWVLVATVADVEGAPLVEQPLVGLYARSRSFAMNVEYESVEIVVPDQRPVYGPSIATDLKETMLGKNSSVYLRMPFNIEGDPSRFDELSMLARFDDGFQAYLNGTPIVSDNVPIDAAWNSAASSLFGAVGQRIPTRRFALPGFTDLLRPGENVLAVHAMNLSAADPDFFFEALLDGAVIVEQTEQYFVTPTPGSLNQSPAAPPPVIIGDQGVFFDSTTIELAVPDANLQLEIRYTLDGSEPTMASSTYSVPITLFESAMLQARIFDTTPTSGVEPGPVVSGTFIAVASELKERTSDIPLVIVDTLRQGIPSSTSTSLRAVNVLALDVSKATGRSSFDGGLVDYLGRGGVRKRGSSTGGQPKPNLAFETWGASGTTADDDEDVGLLGFSPESDWVLHAPFSWDPAMIRNQLAFGMSNEIGRWAPETRAIEVYLNRRDGVVDENDYVGVYVLTEKIKRDSSRVDIAKITPEDNQEPEISGGYIWKIDRPDPDETGFFAGGENLNWVEPKSPRSGNAPEDQRATDEQQAWVVDYFNEFRSASLSPDISDPEGYSKYIDVLSWIDHHLISVLADNVDALNLSTYLFKDRDKKIEFGPLWDFDRSMESRDTRDDDPLQWGGSGGTRFFTSSYWTRLFRDPGFWQAYVDRWTELRRGPLSDASLDVLIDKYASEVAESQERNFQQWRNARPRPSSPYFSGALNGTWEGEIKHLRTWLHARAQFMDGNFTQPPTLLSGGDFVPVGGMRVEPGTSIDIVGPQLTFFDDTELVSSELGAVTAKYFAPTDDTLGDEWTQPQFDDTEWPSGPLGMGYDEGDDYAPLIRTEARPAEGGTTVLLRVPFRVDDVKNIDSLVLRMRYDDGYVAYLNGTEFTRRNLRESDLAWNSRARSQVDTKGVVFEDFEIATFAGLLNPGDNLLGIRLINSSPTSTDLFAQPALVNRRVDFGISTIGEYYFTTDGSDPRGPDGNPSPTAQLALPGHQISITENTKIIARNFDDVTDRGTESQRVLTDWSAPVEYNFVTQDPDLVISELNYNPAPATQEEAEAGFDSDDFEFIEIYNAGSTAASLIGVHLSDSVGFEFFNSAITSLNPKQYVLVVANLAAFQQRYGTDLPVAGEYTGRLSNGGEDVDLADGIGNVIFSVNYQDSPLWGVASDGMGATLELIHPDAATPATQSKWYEWRSSGRPNGTPGGIQETPMGVVINEVLARTSQPVTLTDSIELWNSTEAAIDLGGLYLSDDASNLAKFPIPAGTTLEPGQYIVFDEQQFNRSPPAPGGQKFALNGLQGESVWLVALDENGYVTRFVDDVHFGSTLNGESQGRSPERPGRLIPLTRPSLGGLNGSPRVGPVILSEVQYNPTVSAQALAEDPSLEVSDLEFVEVHNPTSATVELTGWRLRGGVDYEFDSGTTLAAGRTLVVLKFDPSDPENINQVNAFRAQYGIDDQVPLVGGYRGRLNNSDDRVTLLRPHAEPAGSDSLTFTADDEVLYDDLRPWPTGADGHGGSLQRRSPAEFGGFASSWFSAPGTPGAVPVSLPGDFDGDGVVSAVDVDFLNERLRIGDNDLAFDLNADGTLDTVDRDLLITSILGTDYGDSNLDGQFDSADFIVVSALGEFQDTTPGNSGWSDGDWNGDGDFTSADFVAVLSRGAFVQQRVAAARAGVARSIYAPTMQSDSEAAAAVDAAWSETQEESPRPVDLLVATLIDDCSRKLNCGTN